MKNKVIFSKPVPLITLLRLVLLVLFFPSLCYSEASESRIPGGHSLRMHIGTGKTRDQNLGVIVHDGKSIGLGYSWSLRDYGITEVDVNGAYSKLMQPLEFDSESFAFETQLGFTKLTPAFNVEGLYVGGAAVLWTELSYYPYWDEQHVYWATSSYLALSARYEFLRGNGLHALYFQTPFVSLVSRPDDGRLTVADDISFSGFTDSIFSDMEFGFLNRHRGFTAGYEYLFGWKRRKLGITAEVNYHRIDKDTSQPFERQQVLFGARYLF